VSFAGRIDEDRLVRAVRLTLDAEPVLGCRFVEHWFRPYWERFDDLAMKFCEVRQSSDCRADMLNFLDSPPDVPLRVLLLRGETDLLCIKLDHRAGDGAAMREYAYLLADIYNRLRGDPNYRPVPNVSGHRGMRELGDRFSFRERVRIVRHAVQAVRQFRMVRTWEFPPLPPDEAAKLEALRWRLDAARVRAIFDYAYRRRTTVGQVLLAAFYLTVYHTRPQPAGRPLRVITAVDLRRYLPSKRAPALCNLIGASLITIDPRSGDSLDGVVTQVRDQIQSQRREHLGLPLSSFVVDNLPVLRHLRGLIPYRYYKQFARRNQRNLRGRKGTVGGVVAFTDLGELEADRLAFAGADITDACVTTGAVRDPGGLAMATSEFQGSVTGALGFGTRAFVTRLFEHLTRILPA